MLTLPVLFIGEMHWKYAEYSAVQRPEFVDVFWRKFGENIF
jgi:hypothetical protein